MNKSILTVGAGIATGLAFVAYSAIYVAAFTQPEPYMAVTTPSVWKLTEFAQFMLYVASWSFFLAPALGSALSLEPEQVSKRLLSTILEAFAGYAVTLLVVARLAPTMGWSFLPENLYDIASWVCLSPLAYMFLLPYSLMGAWLLMHLRGLPAFGFALAPQTVKAET